MNPSDKDLNNLVRTCPKCGSSGVLTERRPKGDSSCLDCGHRANTDEFSLTIKRGASEDEEKLADRIEGHKGVLK